MKIEYGFEGVQYEVGNITGDSSKGVSFIYRAPPAVVQKKVIESRWVSVEIEFLDDETARLDYPDSDIRGAVIPIYRRPGELLIIDIGDSYVFHCRIITSRIM
ncbi:MAG: hypothetical protein H7A53_07095 [Akkermansiaceae bacterium]|nr:hypothetical protein [Akkermansiaceae bacterium]MCP5550638.1 hypothetical protein [Akkermansiaceae bacterium]